MKKLLVSTIFASILASGVACADDGGFMVGEKYGSTRFSNSVSDNLDDTHGNGILLGYDFGNNLALQLEFLRANGNFAPSFGNMDYGIQTSALYLAYRTLGDFYALAKAGYLRERISVSGGTSSIDGSDTGLSWGVGAGYHFVPSFSLEAEYTVIEKDLSFVSIGFNFNF